MLVQYRINSVDGGFLRYRPSKLKRAPISEYVKELLTLNQATTSLDIRSEEPAIEPRVSKRAKLVVRNVVAKQFGIGQASDESLVENLCYIVSLSEKTVIMVEGGRVEKTNDDPDLSFLRQALIHGNEAHLPIYWQLFMNILSVELGPVFVANKSAVAESLREWVIQMAHGDHWLTQQIPEFSELAYWPGKLKDLMDKTRSCLVCFQSGKNLTTRLLNSGFGY